MLRERERESPCALDCLSTNILYNIVPHQLKKHLRWRALIFAWDEKIEGNIQTIGFRFEYEVNGKNGSLAFVEWPS
jgi:hypothetical protein